MAEIIPLVKSNAKRVAAMPIWFNPKRDPIHHHYFGIPITYLGEGKDNPNWEAFAPEGWHFGYGEQLHSFLGTDLKDIHNRVRGACLEPCDENCGGGK